MSETIPPSWPPAGDVPDPRGDGVREPTPADRLLASSWLRGGVLVVGLGLLAVTQFWVFVLIMALTVFIFLHEMGHYLVAKRNGMKVTEFFLGFGPRIWSFRRGETEYGVKLIWVGAYVKIIGMSNLEDVDPADEDRTYRAKSFGKRVSTVLAGPLTNILLGFLLLVVVFAGFGRPSETKWSVDSVSPGSAAAAAGLQSGDQLIAFDGQTLDGWSEFRSLAQANAGTTVQVTVLRDGTELVVPVSLGWGLTTESALILGLDEGDRVTSVDGVEVPLYADLVGALGRADGPATVEYARIEDDGSTTIGTVEVTGPVELPAEGSRGLLGITRESVIEHPSVPEAAADSVGAFGEVVTRSIEGMGRVFSPSGISNLASQVANAQDDAPSQSTGSTSSSGGSGSSSGTTADADRPSSIIGIVSIGAQLGEEVGWAGVLALLATVNIFLGLINLVPLLPLDGGHIVVACYEEIRSRISGRQYRVNMAKLMPVTYVVLLLMVGLFLSTAYLDIVNPINLN